MDFPSVSRRGFWVVCNSNSSTLRSRYTVFCNGCMCMPTNSVQRLYQCARLPTVNKGCISVHACQQCTKAISVYMPTVYKGCISVHACQQCTKAVSVNMPTDGIQRLSFSIWPPSIIKVTVRSYNCYRQLLVWVCVSPVPSDALHILTHWNAFF